MATLESIQARIAKLQVQAQELVAKQSTVVLDKIRELRGRSTKGAPKYANPAAGCR